MLREVLEKRLAAMPEVTVEPWRDTALICVNFRGKEVAHFQADRVVDIRLTPKIIKAEGLGRALCAKHHPKRSANSRWVCVGFETDAEVDRVYRLIEDACTQRG